MVSLGTVVDKLPARNRERLIIEDQDEADIIDEILVVHDKYAGDYDKIYQFFDQGNVYDTSECLWDFLKENLRYHAETVHDQTVRSPYRILQAGDKVDCKHYSLFIGGCLSAIQRSRACNWDWCYRFASYTYEPVAAHVFVVVTTDEGEIWDDPVLDSFNEDKYPVWHVDEKPASAGSLSGLNARRIKRLPVFNVFKYAGSIGYGSI